MGALFSRKPALTANKTAQIQPGRGISGFATDITNLYQNILM
jgi:hypothetical protein